MGRLIVADRSALATGPLVDSLFETTLDLFAADDGGEIAARALAAAARLLAVESASIWVPDGDYLECRGAIGDSRLEGVRIPAGASEAPSARPGLAPLDAEIRVGDQLTALLRVSRIPANGGFSSAERTVLQRIAGAAGSAMEKARKIAVLRETSADRARDLSLITEMSREIGSTLDLDRVLGSVVNLATRMLSFDRGAIAICERGKCDIRAVTGSDGIDPSDPALQDLALRAAWAAGRGEHFYLSDRAEPATDAERIFAQVFGVDLQRDGASSALYLPLKDEEGVVGILLFEAQRPDFATPYQRDLAMILANQATVAVRNARLYQQIPLVDVLGAFARRRQALLALPRRPRTGYLVAALAVLAAVTLIRWPVRVIGKDPILRPLGRAEARPTVSGIIDRVMVREGALVARGTPVAHLLDTELRARYDAAVSAAASAERASAIAASRGDAADERLQRARATVLAREAEILEQQLRSMTVRSPADGTVLTARPQDRIGTYIEAGDSLIVVGRTDSLEVELGVEQSDVARVQPGEEVRLRVSALPHQTFYGRVVSIGAMSSGSERGTWFPVRAVVANDGGVLRPGMGAHARVLTPTASLAGRLLRRPLRAIRLLWWRAWS
jgi:multidrug resistance efflux pump